MVSALGVSTGVEVCRGGVYPEGVCPGVCLPRGEVSAQGVSSQTHPSPVNRMTDACENITLRNYVAYGKKGCFSEGLATRKF